MVRVRPLAVALLVGAVMGLALQACMRFDPALQRYCEDPSNAPAPCTCTDAGLRGELSTCCINPTFRCDPGQPCCGDSTCVKGADGGGVCTGAEPDGGTDAGTDAGSDAGADAGSDAGTDGG